MSIKTERDALLLQTHLETCRLLVGTAADAQNDGADIARLMADIVAGLITLQVLTTLGPAPTAQVLVIDQSGQRREVFRICCELINN